MLKRIVTKKGMVITDHTLEQDITGYYDETFDIFLFDDKDVKIYGIVHKDNIEMQDFMVPDGSINTKPLSDPRLRISVEECREITVNIIKSWCNEYILKEYPFYKQLNIIGRSGYTDQDKKNMDSFIQNVRTASDNIEKIFDNYTVPEQDKKTNMVMFDYRSYVKNFKG